MRLRSKPFRYMLEVMDLQAIELVWTVVTVSAVLLLPFGTLAVGKIRFLPPPAGVEEGGIEGDRKKSKERSTSICIVIPARNEEENLGELLERLSLQMKSDDRVVVVDDNSEDRTAGVARAFGATVVSAGTIPSGWTGKNRACFLGAEYCAGERRKGLSSEMSGIEYLLFLDADVRPAPDALERLKAASGSDRVVSVQPYHRTGKFSETLSAFPNLIVLAGIAPFGVLASKLSPRGLFGPCILVAAELYFRCGGHRVVADSIVEDVELAGLFSGCGADLRVFAGGKALEYRMYSGRLKNLIEGWNKNLSAGASLSFGRVKTALGLWMAGIAATFFSLGIGIVAGGDLVLLSGLLYTVYAAEIYRLLRKVGNFGVHSAILYPLHFIFFLYLMGGSLYMTKVKRKVGWKGRSVSVSSNADKRRSHEKG